MGKNLTEKQFRKLITKSINRIDYVNVTLNNDSTISGFILKATDKFLMMEEAFDFALKGISIIPFEIVKSIPEKKIDKTRKKIFLEENLLKFDEKIIANTNIDNYKKLFKSIKKQNLHCIVESRKNKKDIFSIGEILGVSEKSVTIKNYDASGKIKKKPDVILFKNIVVINFNDHYSKTFRKYIK